MAISREERRRQRAARFQDEFGGEADAALDLIELIEFAWHDCYGEIPPPERVIEDILVVSHGSLSMLVRAARLAISDWRDLRLAAQHSNDR